MRARAVSDAEIDRAIATWRDQGLARLPAVLDEEALGVLRARFDDLVAGRQPDPGLFFQPDSGTGRYQDLQFGSGWVGPPGSPGAPAYRKVERLERDPLFWAWITHPLCARIVGRVIPGAASIYRATVFSKAARIGSDLPWHQDGGRFWGLDRDPALQLWTALDPAPAEAGCLEFLPGSQAWGMASPLGGVVPEEAVAARQAEQGAVSLPAEAGDLVLVHNLCWHRSGPNRSEAPRRALTVCYMPAETRCLRRKRAPREFVRVFEGIASPAPEGP